MGKRTSSKGIFRSQQLAADTRSEERQRDASVEYSRGGKEGAALRQAGARSTGHSVRIGFVACVCFVCLLQEVVRRASCDVRLSPARRRVELQERVLQVLVDLHDRSLIAAAVALENTHAHTDKPRRAEKRKTNGGVSSRPHLAAPCLHGLAWLVLLLVSASPLFPCLH